MTSYSRPGVFVSTSLSPLTSSPGAGTSGAVACFAAPFNAGPTNPVLVTSWQQYVSLFGSATSAGSLSAFNGFGNNALPYAVYQYFTNGGSACYVVRAPNTDAVLATASVPSIAQDDAGDGPENTSLITLTATSPGAWANSLYYEIVPVSGGTTDGTAVFNLNIYNGGTAPGNLVESWPAVSLNPGYQRNLLGLVNSASSGSKYVTASLSADFAYSPGTGNTDPAGTSSPVAFSSGSDGTAAFTDSAFANAVTTGYSGDTWSIGGLANVPSNLVLNVNCPGSSIAVYNTVISWAEGQGNVFVVIDGPQVNSSTTGVQESSSTVAASYTSLVSGSSGAVLTAASCAAVYGPWLSISDPASSSPTATALVAPGGAILGAYAVSDATYNVAQSPAGVQATVNCIGLETNFSPADLSALESAQINPVKIIPGAGYCIFGARTLAVGYPNRYVNVARTLMQFTTDFQAITQFAIFQNNDPTLWASITNVLNNYLGQAMQAGMLASTTAASAYSVVCDSTVNTPTTAQAGLVYAQVAVALVSPAEFIIINLSQMASGSSTATVSA